MKKILLLFVLLPLFCRAQNSPPYVRLHARHDSVETKIIFISINAGVSVPLQDYGASGTIVSPNEIQGFAKNGYHCNISGGIFVSSQIALVANAGLDDNSVNQAMFQAQNGGTATQNFRVWQYMGGLSYHVAFQQAASFWVQVMLGSVTVDYPSFTETINRMNYTLSLPNESALGYSLGIGLEEMIGRNIGLVGNLSYTSASINYASSALSSIGVVSNQNSTTIMVYGSVQLTAGINFHL